MALSSLIVCALKLYPSYDTPPRRSVATYSRDERMPQASRIVRRVPRSDGSVVIMAPSAKVAHRSRVRFKVARWTLPVCRRSMRGRSDISRRPKHPFWMPARQSELQDERKHPFPRSTHCLLYTSDAADERSSVDLGGRRI